MGSIGGREKNLKKGPIPTGPCVHRVWPIPSYIPIPGPYNAMNTIHNNCTGQHTGQHGIYINTICMY